MGKEIRKMNTELNLIFSNIEEILTIHQKLLKILYELPRSSWPELHGLGDAFSSISSHWNVYGTYVNNYKFAQELVDDCSKSNEHFRSFLEKKLNHTGFEL